MGRKNRETGIFILLKREERKCKVNDEMLKTIKKRTLILWRKKVEGDGDGKGRAG